MRKKSYIVFFTIFIFILLLNFMKPLSSDDYFLAFIWPEGVKLNGLLPENAVRITSLEEVCKSVKEYYFIWGGRLPAQILMTFFVWQGKALFNILNSFVFLLLIAEIYWLSHEGRVSLEFDASYIVWIFFSLWAFNVGFNDTILWVAGSCTYLWMVTIVLAFLIPYVRNYYDSGAYNDHSQFIVGMFVAGFLAGCSFEVVICWVLLLLSYWLYCCKTNHCLQNWQIAGYIGLCLGYMALMLSPGNYVRLVSEHNSEPFPIVLLSNVMENLVILTFHLLPWYFLLNFLYRYVRSGSNFKNNNAAVPYLNLIKAYAAIACCCGVVQFVIPSGGYRNSFITLIVLTIAAATIFRLCQKTKLIIINRKEKVFLKSVAACYLILSVSFSLWGNYINWLHWNSILAKVKEAQSNNRNTVLLAEPYPIRENSKINLLSGFHISQMPFRGVTETDEINRTFARYYGIKGIKVSQ